MIDDMQSKVIYILGSGHCGSTVLDMVLGSHSNIIGLGECEKAPAAWHKGTMCACGSIVRECPFWKNIFSAYEDSAYAKIPTRHISRNKIAFILDRSKYTLLTLSGRYQMNEHFITEYLSFMDHLYQNALMYMEADFVVDSTKNVDSMEILYKYCKVEPCIVHLVRDIRGVLYSAQRKGASPWRWLLRWVSENIKILILAKRTGVPYIKVRYEQFAENPEEVVRCVLNKINLEYEADMLHFRSFEHHQPAGNRMRYGTNNRIKPDIEWKNNLSGQWKLASILSLPFRIF